MADPTKTSKTADAKTLLSNLTAGKKPAAKKAAPQRQELDLSPSFREAFTRLAGASALAEVVVAYRDQAKTEVEDEGFKMWVEKLWKNKARPTNPALKVEKDGKVDTSGIFQVHDRYSLAIPDVPEGSTAEDVVTALFVDMFTERGMAAFAAQDAAARLVANELDFTPKTYVDLNRLITGHYEQRNFIEATAEEQALGAKVIRLLQARSKADLGRCDPLTDEEAGLVIEVKYSVVVKPGFLQRVPSYVNSEDQLRAIFQVIKPVRYPSHIKFAASDTPEEKNRRLLEVTTTILGASE